MASTSFRILLVGKSGARPLDRVREGFADERLRDEGIEPLTVSEVPRWIVRLGDRDTEADRLTPRTDREQAAPIARSRLLTARVRLDPSANLDRAKDVLKNLSETLNYDAQSNPPISSGFWASSQQFGRLDEAVALIGGPATGGGSPVNVVIIDQGFDKRLVSGPFGGGWYQNGPSPQLPGEGTSRHAITIARAVRAIAPDAVLFDAPLIPTPPPGALPTINEIPAFADAAASLWQAIWAVLASGVAGEASWVFVNAWALTDVTSDRLAPRPHYSTDRIHILNLLTDLMVATENVDFVFAAGNCGQFQPDIRCGRDDRGPCRSIWGANSLDTVLTLGAVRTDRSWLGYSSEGFGQDALGLDKPDLCAPSQFIADDDAALIYGGTSAAAAVAGGVVAVLRSRRPQFGPSRLDAADLRTALLNNVLRPEPNQPKYRIGAGVIQLADTLAAISG